MTRNAAAVIGRTKDLGTLEPGKLGDLVILDGDPLADSSDRLCTKNTSWALIERPYSCAPQAVGAVYMTAQDFLCKAVRDKTLLNQQSSYRRCGVIFDAFIECNLSITNANDAVRIPSNVAFVRH